MNPEARAASTASEPSIRESLTRALASESRDALARVELAASELARSGLAPALAHRVSAIRAAVDEIDGLLGKIDLLADGARVPDRSAVDLAAVAGPVLDRISPVLRARGVELAWVGRCEGGGDLAVGAPQATVELLCLGLVRLVAGAVPSAAAQDLIVSEARTVELDAVRRGDDVCFISRSTATSRASRFDRTARLELEVILAEWRGAFLIGDDPEIVEVGFALPAASLTPSFELSAGQGPS